MKVMKHAYEGEEMIWFLYFDSYQINLLQLTSEFAGR